LLQLRIIGGLRRKEWTAQKSESDGLEGMNLHVSPKRSAAHSTLFSRKS